MSFRRIIPFKISVMDSLGQGVSKASDKITFIAKTVIGDEGEAEVIAEKKGVAFARPKSFSKQSALRQDPFCPHFSDCPSCHYQHVSYESELKFKQEALEKLLFRIKTPPIKVIGSPTRFEYRNRIQLHYDLTQKTLGMLNIRSNKVLPIPNCLIGLPQVNQEIRRLYQNENWLKEAPSKVERGHVEIYWSNEQLKVTWNKAYSEGGFTQVFETMNQILKVELASWSALGQSSVLLDLFAGNGNLSQNLNYYKRLCVDIYKETPADGFLSQDLYHHKALQTISQELKNREFFPDCLLLDPPRSGMKDLNLWLEKFSPKAIAYVSCDPHTMVRDISSLTNYEITRAFLIDFFPSTFHFETMLFLERKN